MRGIFVPNFRFSTQIPIASQKKVHLELKSLANKTLMPLIRECIDQYEEDVPSGTYPEFGFSMFEYRDHIKSKKEVKSHEKISDTVL